MLQKNSSHSKNKICSGFSFMETIISVFLISIGMVAIISLIASSLRESMDSRDQVIATLLSQEGIELTRNARDNNWVNDRNTFDSAGGFPNSSNNNCLIASNMNAVSCGASSFILKLSNNVYNYNSGSNTKFQRKISIKYENDSTKNTAEVVSMVIWGKKFPTMDDCNSLSKCVYAKTTLSSWGGN